MIDFNRELDKLIEQEPHPMPGDELAEILSSGQRSYAALGKKQTELSFQMEEIYDIISNMDTSTLQDALQTEKQRAGALTGAAIGLCDILEDFCAYAQSGVHAEGGGSEGLYKQARMMWANSAELLERCGLTRIGEEGQQLNPDIHSVQSMAASPLPREHVTRVLQSGYRYLGQVVRKAAVVLSDGTEATGDE